MSSNKKSPQKNVTAEQFTNGYSTRTATVTKHGKEYPAVMVYRPGASFGSEENVGHVRKLESGCFRWVAAPIHAPLDCGDVPTASHGVQAVIDYCERKRAVAP